MKAKALKILLAGLMTLSTLWIFWLSLTPLIDRDGTRFHLPFAKIWAENGFMYFRKWWAYYDLNMLNLNYLYMLVFKFSLPDQLTKIIHASFLIGGGCLIFKYFKEKYGFNWGAVSFIMYVTVPIHQRLASEVYVDLGLLFFSTLSILYFIKWFESDFENLKYLIISALGAGFGFGTKYNGVIFALFMTLFVALVISREKKNDKAAVKSMLIYGMVIFISVLPWLLRNFINSGNPFFPLFNSIFQSDIIMPPEIMENVGSETAWRMVASKENFFTLLLLPFRAFFEGEDHDLLKFDGVLNPLMLLLLPLVFLPLKKGPDKKTNLYIFALFVTVFLSTLYANNIRIRYFIPVIPILIILNVESIRTLFQNKKFSYSAHLAAALFISYNMVYSFTLFSSLHLSQLNPLSKNSRARYIEKYLPLKDIYDFINSSTPDDCVIYEAFTGGKSYQINRTFYCDTASIDRYLFDLAKKGADSESYRAHFRNLPNSSLSASYLLIRPNALTNTFKDIYSTEQGIDKAECEKYLFGYYKYLNSLQIVKVSNGAYLFKLTD